MALLPHLLMTMAHFILILFHTIPRWKSGEAQGLYVLFAVGQTQPLHQFRVSEPCLPSYRGSLPRTNYISQRPPGATSSASAACASGSRFGRARGGGGDMADVLSVGVNLEAFAQAISAIQALRSSVSRVFDCLKDGMRNKETLEGREKAFIAHFQDNLHSVNRDLNELERLSNLVGKPSENHPLHNSGLLSLDPVQDKTPLYSQLLQAYKWSNKLQYHAGLASGLLNQQSLKRSANQMGVSAKRRPKAQPTTLVLPPQYVDDVISRIDRMFPEMSIHLSRPNGTSAMLLVTLGKVLKVVVVMRSLFIDRTIVKGYHEDVYTEDGKKQVAPSKPQCMVAQWTRPAARGRAETPLVTAGVQQGDEKETFRRLSDGRAGVLRARGGRELW
uniref:Mediator of RNA polymerase II transcription subunit 27 n=1 Tax=Oryctolagus cuniculus TaxID=9986 RepID=A0A5F9DQ90_RABIT